VSRIRIERSKEWRLSMEKLNVLCVEDCGGLLEAWKLYFENGEINLILAKSLTEAEEKFKIHGHELSAIVMDGCVPGVELNTLPLLKMILKTFKGPVIATSSLFNRELMEAGCNCECDKVDLIKKLKDVLGLK
jgi:DNA-binding NtrC family response regulator